MAKTPNTIRLEVAGELLALEAKLHDRIALTSWTGNDQLVADRIREAHHILLGIQRPTNHSGMTQASFVTRAGLIDDEG